MKDNYFVRCFTRLRLAGLHWVLLNPLLSLLANPYALIRSLYNLRIMRGEKWRYYNGHSSSIAFVNIFYWTTALNLQRYGHSGISPTLGCGAFDMRYFWFQSLPALTLTSSLGRIMTALIGMSIWYFSHLAWFYQGPSVFYSVLTTLICTLFCSNFYGNLFGSQNYNIFAWAFFPIALWGVMEHHFFITAIAWLAIPFLSITVFFIAVITTILFSFLYHDLALVITLLPGMFYFAYAIRLFDLTLYRTMKKHVVDMLAMIGTHRKNRYKRQYRIVFALGIASLLATFPLCIAFLGVTSTYLTCQDLVLISLLPVCFFLINESQIIRIADTQTSLMFFFTISTAVTIVSSSYLLLGLFWMINSNAIIAYLHYHFDCSFRDKIQYTPVVQPFNIAPFLKRMETFI